MTNTSINRRVFFERALSGAGVLTAAWVGRRNRLVAQSASDKFVAIINLAGGNDGLNTVVPHTVSTTSGGRRSASTRARASLSKGRARTRSTCCIPRSTSSPLSADRNDKLPFARARASARTKGAMKDGKFVAESWKLIQ